MLYLVRHGETDWNNQGRWQGHSDISLNDHGVEQAKSASTFFKEHRIDIAYSSDLGRALQTAEILIGDADVDIIPDPVLRERSFGPLEGKTTEQIGKILGRDVSIMEIVSEDIPLEGVETIENQFLRAETFLRKIKKDRNSSKLAVSHGVFIGILLQLTTGIDFKKRKVGNCEIIKVEGF